jgi:hypothetical protein
LLSAEAADAVGRFSEQSEKSSAFQTVTEGLVASKMDLPQFSDGQSCGVGNLCLKCLVALSQAVSFTFRRILPGNWDSKGN